MFRRRVRFVLLLVKQWIVASYEYHSITTMYESVVDSGVTVFPESESRVSRSVYVSRVCCSLAFELRGREQTALA